MNRHWLVATKTRSLLLAMIVSVVFVAVAACGSEADPTAVPATTIPTSTVGTADPTATTVSQAPTSAPGTQTPAVPTATSTVEALREPPDPESSAREATIVILEFGATGVTGLNSTGGAGAHMNIGESLFRPEGPTGSNVAGNWLVEDWELADDLSKVTIHLKNGVEFHGGWGEMTAEDVAFSYNDLISDTSIHTSAGRFRSVFDQMSVIDEDTVEIPFKTFSIEWNSSMLNVFISPIEIFSKAAYDANGHDWARDNPVATGAFHVTDYRPDDLLVLEAMPEHHYLRAGMDVLRVREVPEESTRTALMNTGAADIGEIALRNIRGFLEDGFKTSDSGKSGQVGVFFSGNYWEEFDFNCANGFRSPSCPDITVGEPEEVAVSRPGYQPELPWIGEFGDDGSMEQARLVRTAMSLAVDREAINDVILDALGWPVHIGGFSIYSPHWDSKWETPFDPDEANRLLDEAGFPMQGGSRFTVDLATGPHAGGATGTLGEIQDAVAGMWNDVGINVTVNKVAYTSFRPSVVDRSATSPWINACGGSDARDSVPWDFPKGIAFSTLSRGGFNCAIELPIAAETFGKVAGEPDINKRIEYNTELLEYYHHWRINSGILVIPEPFVWNTKTVKEWEMRANASGTFISSFDTIVSAR